MGGRWRGWRGWRGVAAVLVVVGTLAASTSSAGGGTTSAGHRTAMPSLRPAAPGTTPSPARHGPPSPAAHSPTPSAGAPRPAATRPAQPLPAVVYRGSRDRPWVALTFDSNMTSYMLQELASGKIASFYNQQVVDELDALKVPATFFLTGRWIERYPEATRRLAADPLFELGSHSYSHLAFHLPCYGLAAIPTARMAADVTESFRVLARFTSHPTRYFRFPGGCYDAAALRSIAPAGATVVQYDVASGDAFGTSADTIVSHTLAAVGNGSIVVLHITGGNTAPLTAQALPRIVAGLRARGYQLVTLSRLLAP